MEICWNLNVTNDTAAAIENAEERVVAAAMGGDPDAFSTVVRLHERRVFRLAGRFFRQRADVEDAAQETFLTAWRKRHTYRAEAPFEHWITRVCLNCCYEKLRRGKKNRQTAELADDLAAPAADPDAGLEVERLLDSLDPRDRFVLLLLDGEGWSVAEIADRIGWSRANVKVRAHRARKKLRRLLERGLES
jgi:RNA polymerase sigma-70 factor (ECF subfamily)